MKQYAEISVNIPQVTGLFHYHLPVELAGRIQAGHLVVVPFGKQTVQGVVLRMVEQPMVAETRAVIELVDPAPVLTAGQITLAKHLAEHTLAPLAACIELMLPSGLAQQIDSLYTAAPIVNETDFRTGQRLSATQARLMNLLRQRGPLRSQQITHAMGRMNWQASSRSLVKQGLLTVQSFLPPPRVRPKTTRTVQLACPPEEAELVMNNLARSGTPALARRQAMLRFLLSEGRPVDVAWLYAESSGNPGDLSALTGRGLVTFSERESWRDPLEQLDVPTDEPLVLTHDQEQAWNEINLQLHQAAPTQPILLHGVTGSGKTELYLKAAAEVIRLGRQAIILVPEIALTPQTIRRFGARFPAQVGLIHSRLSEGERYDTWRRARQGDLSVVVGPRSALFTPFAKLGLIVVDECHDDSYYQADPVPIYHARQAAIEYARILGAVCLLGSATPSVTTTYAASRGQIRYLRLPARILAHRQVVKAQVQGGDLPINLYQPHEGQADAIDLPPVNLVDMRQELQAGNHSIFSRQLYAGLEQVLAQQQQAILFLNRRGASTYVFCRNCGHVLKCPQCDLPLTYHIHAARIETGLLCHRCGYSRKNPQRCPQCNSPHIRHYGTGTERVEAELKSVFPQARTLRWDFETTRKKGSHEIILSHFAAHRADFLIGTQMIAKGLDFPLVTLVGIVLADVGLNLPDYRAPERSFQILTQVAGRAGRSPLGGQVILQSFQPDHYVIQAASRHNYREFYRQELDHRRRLGYPPFSRLVRLEYRHADALQAEQAARALANDLSAILAAEENRLTQIIGPAPCYFSRLANLYRWQIVLRGPDPASLLRHRPLGEWKIEVDPINLL